MPLLLSLSGRDIRNCSIGSDSESVVFKVVTSDRGGGNLLKKQTVTTVTRYDPIKGDWIVAGEIERNRFKNDRLRTPHFIPQTFFPIDKFLMRKKNSWWDASFVGENGVSYTWKTGAVYECLELFRDNISPLADAKPIACYYKPKHERGFLKGRLKIHREAREILDSVIVTFILMEEQRELSERTSLGDI